MLANACGQAGAKVLSEPGPEPIADLRYLSTSWCSTPRLLLLHSWPNGEPVRVGVMARV